MLVLFNGEAPPMPWPDPAMGDLVARYAEYCADDGGELTVTVVEPGDTLRALDAASNDQFTVNCWSDKRLGDDGFVPAFETLHERATFYEATFIQGNGFACTLVLIPKRADIDAEILSLCSAHATPAPEMPARGRPASTAHVRVLAEPRGSTQQRPGHRTGRNRRCCQPSRGKLPPLVAQQRRRHQACADHCVLRPAWSAQTVVTSNSRTARCGPACRVVWQGCLR